MRNIPPSIATLNVASKSCLLKLSYQFARRSLSVPIIYSVMNCQTLMQSFSIHFRKQRNLVQFNTKNIYVQSKRLRLLLIDFDTMNTLRIVPFLYELWGILFTVVRAFSIKNGIRYQNISDPVFYRKAARAYCSGCLTC